MHFLKKLLKVYYTQWTQTIFSTNIASKAKLNCDGKINKTENVL